MNSVDLHTRIEQLAFGFANEKGRPGINYQRLCQIIVRAIKIDPDYKDKLQNTFDARNVCKIVDALCKPDSKFPLVKVNGQIYCWELIKDDPTLKIKIERQDWIDTGLRKGFIPKNNNLIISIM